MNFFTTFHHFLISLPVSHDLKNPQMSLGRPQIWVFTIFGQGWSTGRGSRAGTAMDVIHGVGESGEEKF